MEQSLIEHIKSFLGWINCQHLFYKVSATARLSVLLYHLWYTYYNCKTEKINPKSIKYILGTGYWYVIENKDKGYRIMTMSQIFT